MKAIIGIGSNMGDRRNYIEQAIMQIDAKAGRILKRSSVIETRAYGYEDQADYLNLAVEIETDLSARALLERLHEIEADLDRVRLIRWGPRTIDLDIEFYGDVIIDEEDLHIPHIDIYNREFVLGPVCEIAPDLVDPRTGRTVRTLLEELRQREEEKAPGEEQEKAPGAEQEKQAPGAEQEIQAGPDTQPEAGEVSAEEETEA